MPSDAESVIRQPKRMALLTYLACQPAATFARRDTLLALLWPESDDARARQRLRQSLHVLRGALGADAFLRRGDAEVALDRSLVSCDAAQVIEALSEGRAADAVHAYHGDLLPGFHLPDAPEFERWLEDTRARLRRRIADASHGVSVEKERGGDLAGAVEWARRAHEQMPENEAAFRRLLSMLDRSGDRAGALLAYAAFARRLRQDFEVEPASETQRLVQSLRQSGAVSPPGATSATGTPATGTPAAGAPAAGAPAAGATAAGATEPSSKMASGPNAGVNATGITGASRAFPKAPGRRRRRALLTVGIVIAATTVLLTRAIDTRSAAESAAPLAPSRGELGVGIPGTARLMYDQAMRAWSVGDRKAAERLMRVSYESDSSFGLALLQLGHLLGLRGEHATAQHLQRQAVALASQQPDHDRLLILALYASHFNEPTQLAYAETLAIRYPADVEGQLLVGRARLMSGRFATAVAPLERVIASGRSGRDSTGQRCLSCEAYYWLTLTHESMDSLPAAERTVRAWLRARPFDVAAWNMLSYQLAITDRFAEALAARRRADDLGPAGADGNALGEILLRAGDFRTLEDILSLRERTGNTEDAVNARFLHWRLLRERGRWREGLALAEAMERETGAHPSARDLAIALHAQSLLETGRASEAAAVWDSLARAGTSADEPAAAAAIYRMTRLVRVSDALAMRGDTSRLPGLADSVETLGARSSWVRDRRMHHYVRGLLHAARGNRRAACESFMASLTGATTTFARANLAAGTHCLRAGRLPSALTAVRGVLRGPVGAGGTSGTLTEAHRLAAQIFAAMQRPDSARPHLERVAAAMRPDDVAGRLHARAPGGPPSPLGERTRTP